MGALVGPKLIGLRKPKPFAATSASHYYPSVKIEIDPKIIDQPLSGTNAVTRAQIKVLLQTQEVSATAAIE
jgi:hypothetical protein